MVKTIGLNQPLRDLIIQNYIYIGMLSAIIFIKNGDFYLPLLLILNLRQLPSWLR
jgi:hypothetical protein